MTQSPDVPPLLVDDPGGAIEALRESGLRMSTARRLVIEALFDATGPVSAPHLSATLRIDESSVYRNLEVLERHGLVRHLHLGHGPGLYVLVARAEAEYLYCERCETAIAVAPSELDPIREAIRKQFGHTARFTHFAIVGLCQRCASGASASEPRTFRSSQKPQHLY
jgi:Fur family transcriptional regulator, ferric uptake regulator